jgi:hypothetical protein
MTHHTRGAVHERACSGLVEKSGVWQAQVTSAALVGRFGIPNLRRRAPSKTELAMVRAGVVGRASKKAAAARQVMLWWHAREIWHPTVEASCVANKVSSVSCRCRMHTLRPSKEVIDMCCVEMCVCVGFNCLDHLARMGPDGSLVLVQLGGEGPEAFWGFSHSCLCQSIGRQASGGVVQGRGLSDTESAVPQGESKLRLGCGGGSGPQDLLGGGRDGVVYVVGGTM